VGLAVRYIVINTTAEWHCCHTNPDPKLPVGKASHQEVALIQVLYSLPTNGTASRWGTADVGAKKRDNCAIGRKRTNPNLSLGADSGGILNSTTPMLSDRQANETRAVHEEPKYLGAGHGIVRPQLSLI